MTDRPVVVDANVAHVAGRAVGPAIDLAVGNDAAANARADLDKQEVVQPPPRARLVLAAGHNVDVVIDSHARGGKTSAQMLLDRVAFPQRHERRSDEHAGHKLYRPGHADADADDRGRGQTAPRQQLVDNVGHTVEKVVRPAAHVARPGGALQDLAAEVGQGHVEAGRAHVHADHVAQVGVEVEQKGATAAGAFALAGFGQDAGIDHATHNAGDAGAGIVETLREVGAREGALAANGGDDGRLKWFEHQRWLIELDCLDRQISHNGCPSLDKPPAAALTPIIGQLTLICEVRHSQIIISPVQCQ